jgi:hypothetical protein
MMRRAAFVAAGLVCLAFGLATLVHAREMPARQPGVDLPALAVSQDPAAAKQAIAALRAQGPAGLKALIDAYAERIRRGPTKDAAWQRLSCALDSVSAQRDAYASGLFWYTDFEEAKAAASREQKPILSLRMLGELHAELSCANSRFFRTTLYPDPAVSTLLRDRFILHWKSVRPVPVVTIDFGDGRTVKRTVTGNSAHYVLDSQGRTIDCIPGLYSANAFVRELGESLAMVAAVAAGGENGRQQSLRAAHAAALERTLEAWYADMRRAEGQDGVTLPALPEQAKSAPKPAAVPAMEAMERAVTKSVGEVVIAQALTPDFVETRGDGSVWKAMAWINEDDARLSPEVLAVIEQKNPPTAAQAARMAMSKSFVESPLVRMVRNLQRSIAEDTVRNEYLLHRRIHEWFAAGDVGDDVEALNDRVYAELFLTPRSDPWLGLVPADTFTAIEDEGVTGG